jgi:hypothetical protein
MGRGEALSFDISRGEALSFEALGRMAQSGRPGWLL